MREVLLLLLLVLHDFEASMSGGKLIAFLGRYVYACVLPLYW